MKKVLLGGVQESEKGLSEPIIPRLWHRFSLRVKAIGKIDCRI
jgi:hypothetical protein